MMYINAAMRRKVLCQMQLSLHWNAFSSFDWILILANSGGFDTTEEMIVQLEVLLKTSLLNFALSRIFQNFLIGCNFDPFQPWMVTGRLTANWIGMRSSFEIPTRSYTIFSAVTRLQAHIFQSHSSLPLVMHDWDEWILAQLWF